VYLDDQREVLSTIAKDLIDFEDLFIVEECESADEAAELIEDIDGQGDHLGVVISDHVMPGKSGVDFLSDVNNDARFSSTKKILLTGMATHQDTIQAINNARIDKYVEKPWQSDQLTNMVKELVTRFIFEKGIDYQKYVKLLDQKVLFEVLRRGM
ncbi:MAG: response regulator, partial [Bacteroidales bacterium]|nr:response regulator [Bacteroidales bacterium]